MSESNEGRKTAHSKRAIPFFMFQHPWFSLSDKILLIYSTMADSSGRVTLSSRTTLLLAGMEINEANLIAVRKARGRLQQEGHLKHEETKRRDGTRISSWILTAYKVTDDAMSTWKEFQPDREITDIGFGSGTPENPAKPLSPEVEDFFANLGV